MTKIREIRVIPSKTIAVQVFGRQELESQEQELKQEDPKNAREIIELCGQNITNARADICVRHI